MRILVIALLGLSLALLGLHQAQAEGMEKTGDNIGKSQSMQSDGMRKDQTMAQKRPYTVPSDAELRERLTPMQYKVTREDGTEPPYNNAYWDNHNPGIYVDLISGVPLFSSTDKYDSGTGWPSFTRPLDPDNVVVKRGLSFFTGAKEVRSKLADAHLGHVFDDGPQPTGLRYCIDSAALRFIPSADLEKEGYGEFVKLFK